MAGYVIPSIRESFIVCRQESRVRSRVLSHLHSETFKITQPEDEGERILKPSDPNSNSRSVCVCRDERQSLYFTITLLERDLAI